MPAGPPRSRIALEALKHPSILCWLALVAAIWWCAALLIDLERTNHKRAMRSDTTNLSRVFEQNVIRTLREVDKTLLYLRHAHSKQPTANAWPSLFAQAFTPSDMTFQLGVIGADGRLVASDRGPQPPRPIDLSDREHFRVHALTETDVLFISKPLLGRGSGQWAIQASRRLSQADGTFAGVIVASLDPEHFSGFYRSINIGAGGSITLVGLDGVVRASGGLNAHSLGEHLSERDVFDSIRNEADAVVEYTDKATGTRRIAATRWVKDYPLAVIVTTDEDQPGSLAALNRSVYLATATASSALVLCIILAVYRRNRRLLEARRQLERKSRQHSVTLENMAEGIIMVETDGTIGFMNSRFVDLLNLPKDYLNTRRTFLELVDQLERHGEFSNLTDEMYEMVRSSSSQTSASRYERIRPDGTVLEVRTRQLPDGGFVRTLTDITSRHRAEARMLQLASHDALTGLANRSSFREALDEASRQLARGFAFAILMIDLDRFKPVNDTYGHAVGDQLLKLVAERLSTLVRSNDIVGRLGGDEFSIIQMGATEPGQAEALAKRVCRALRQPYCIDGNTLMIGASVGIALPPEHGTTGEQLLYSADMALYAVKAGERGAYAVFRQEMHDEQCARRSLEEDLRQAIESNQFELHYQPIVTVGSGEVAAYEALLRWRHPERGNVPPLEFVRLAEETGLIGPIGAWVLQRACDDMCRREGTARVAVNLSPIQFRDRHLVDIVVAALERSGLPASRLEVEITETTLLQNDELTQNHLTALRDLGVHITMDDFGTGYSSLAYLMSYPIQTLKIDRSFVNGLGEQPSKTAIVKTIITLATSLGISTTAEGVETADQLRVLAELGCAEAQGYYLSRPKPAAEALPPLRKPAAGALEIAA